MCSQCEVLSINGVKCEKCGDLGSSSDMIRYYDLLNDKIAYECKNRSQCFYVCRDNAGPVINLSRGQEQIRHDGE